MQNELAFALERRGDAPVHSIDHHRSVLLAAHDSPQQRVRHLGDRHGCPVFLRCHTLLVGRVPFDRHRVLVLRTLLSPSISRLNNLSQGKHPADTLIGYDEVARLQLVKRPQLVALPSRLGKVPFVGVSLLEPSTEHLLDSNCERSPTSSQPTQM